MKIHRLAIPASTLLVLLQLSFTSLNAHAASVEKANKPPPKTYTIEQFMATSNIGGASFSPDEKKILFNSNESGIFNAYTISISGGKPVALTKSSTDSTYAIGYFYHDERLLLTRDKGGDENNHLFVRELDGTEKDLTPGEKLKAEFFGWTPDGSAFLSCFCGHLLSHLFNKNIPFGSLGINIITKHDAVQTIGLHGKRNTFFQDILVALKHQPRGGGTGKCDHIL